MTHQAHIEQDWISRGVRLHFRRVDDSGRSFETIRFPGQPQVIVLDGAERDPFGVRPTAEDGLSLPEDYARALYEALADYYGHTGHDTRALRRDYDAERARVDRLIAVVTDADRPRVVVVRGADEPGRIT